MKPSRRPLDEEEKERREYVRKGRVNSVPVRRKRVIPIPKRMAMESSGEAS